MLNTQERSPCPSSKRCPGLGVLGGATPVACVFCIARNNRSELESCGNALWRIWLVMLVLVLFQLGLLPLIALLKQA